MSAPRGFITLTERVDRDGTRVYNLARIRASAVAAYSPKDNGGTFVPLSSGECYAVTETPEQIGALIAAAQGDAPTTPEPLPPLVKDATCALRDASRVTIWPDKVQVWLSSEEVRALLAWLDRGRP